jgi:hypothetical protein
MATTGRPILNVALDEATREHLREFCARYGVSATALVEAFARAAIRDDDGPLLATLPPWLTDIIAEARSVDAERGRR